MGLGLYRAWGFRVYRVGDLGVYRVEALEFRVEALRVHSKASGDYRVEGLGLTGRGPLVISWVISSDDYGYKFHKF